MSRLLLDVRLNTPAPQPVAGPSIAWDTIRDAIQSWIVVGSGLSGDHVVWSGQRDTDGNPMPRPVGMFIELRLTMIKWAGFSDARWYAYDQPSNTFTQHTSGPRVAMLTATCFQGAPSGGASIPTNIAPAHPAVVLNEAMAATGRDDISMALVAAGIGVGSIESLDITPAIINTTLLEQRAIVTVQLHLASDLTYTYPAGQGWIDTVNGSGSGDLAPVQLHVTLP